ncbi:protein ERGIC-53-like isoform X5 [Prionailurus viverrinus]|uniref:protein ERGIC-53-like isoform X5 n=1 Tax=Prionailurus viverrinus TaxID=61388 RepID=UPI001FF181F7|nr:protein ERGIC-53-like isoform X5 [Prionailurus viverrinus]
MGQSQVGDRSGVRLEMRKGLGLRSGLEGTGCLLGLKGERGVPTETSSSPPGPVPRAPPLASQLRLHSGAQTPVPFTMLVIRGPDPLFCLLLLLLVGPHNPVGASPPQRRFEYKLSFKGPRLALPGAGIPFWSHHGDAILGLEAVRLAPSMRNRSGAVWSRAPVPFSAWEVHVQMRVTGPGRRGAQGMGCSQWGAGLLPPGLPQPAQPPQSSDHLLGAEAADDHDILSFLTFSLSEPDPKPPPPPFLEMEQLRLVKQLEGLRARLALGAREDVIPKLSSEVQEEGKRILGLEETLGRHRQILQALQGLSRQLAQAERQWKKHLGTPGHARPEGAWDSAKVSALLRGQRSLLQDLQEMRDAAAHVVSKAQLFYLPVGTKHHFSELAQILGLLQKDLRGPLKAAAKNRRPPGQPPGASSCLRPSIFLFFLLIQTIGFFSYVHFSRQELDKSLQDCLSTGSPPLCPAPRIPGALGILRRQPLSSSIHA